MCPLGMVEWPLRYIERLVVHVFVLGNRTRKREYRGLGKRPTQLQREEIAPRSPVAVVERMDIAKEKMAQQGTIRFGDGIRLGKRNPLCQQRFDLAFG